MEWHNLNLGQHLTRSCRISLLLSISVELHDKVIGHYMNVNLNHYPSRPRWPYV
ncbi:hypothetical protein DOT37_21205 [Pantoea agglomerans]|nr:hypothetical protein DOT37_21205 [Pantoea agglomerans]TGX89360.1 hypothetical protein E5821_20065 [Pantoea agglomerans]